MNLERPVSTPKFIEYATHYALKSKQIWPDDIISFDPNPIEIPAYQRKIVWDEKIITDFLKSKAVIFGTVILAKSTTGDSFVLLDGLQRFATSTAILHYLHTKIFPEINDPNVMAYFKRILADTESRKIIFNHNDNELRKNTRIGIRESYEQLYKTVKSVINNLNTKPEELANTLIETFVRKHIAIDAYHGFKNEREYIQTFININSTGINLNQVDLLRSEIIRKAEANNWMTSDIDEIENRFTEVFQSSKIKSTKVLGSHMYDVIDNDDPCIIFKNWDGLTKDDVDNFLDFVDGVYDASNESTKDGYRKWPYLYENLQCGDIPFTIIVWFYYKQKIEHDKSPDFLGGELDTSDDLRVLLRAFYRRVINSSMNRADVVANKLMSARDPEMLQNMRAVANDINPVDTSLDKSVDKSWIRDNIRKSNLGKTRRIFNACLLPEFNSEDCFQPLYYGSGSGWLIDNLIPKDTKFKNSENYEHLDTLMNKIPIRSALKKQLKNKTCLEKLNPESVLGEMKTRHPYVRWLVDTHWAEYANTMIDDDDGSRHILNLPKSLSDTDKTPGRSRLDMIVKLLHCRI